MKSTINKDAPGFTPVSITITFESQKELDAFGSMCNCNPICESVKKAGCDIFDLVGNLSAIGANIHDTSQIAELVAKASKVYRQ